MRACCIECVVKHLAQATILIEEAELGHPIHKYLAIGHLAEASSEALEDYPKLARDIREVRKNYAKENNCLGLNQVFIEAITYLEELNAKAPAPTPLRDGS